LGDRWGQFSAYQYLKTEFEKKEISMATGRALKAAALYWIAEEAQSRLGLDMNLSEHEIAYQEIRNLQTRHLP